MSTVTRDTDGFRQALVEAASTLLANEGPEALTVRRIAAEAGCSTMLVYSRFGGKNGVVDEMFVEGFRRLAKMMRSPRPTGDPLADLRSCGRAYRRFALANPTYYAVMFEGAVPDFEPSLESSAVALGTLDALGERVQRAIDAGVFPNEDRRQLAACLWAANHGVVSLELKHSGLVDIDWPKRHTQVIDAMIAGLAASAKEPRRPPTSPGQVDDRVRAIS